VDQLPGRPAASTARARRRRLRLSLRLRPSAIGRTTGAALLGAALVAGSLAGALPRAAAAVDATPLGTWTTNGDVNSVFAAGGRIYLGGDFDQVGPDTGSGVGLDAATGARPAVFPQVNGPVLAAVPDGSGGWYIGGLFTRVGDKSRQNAARILADGTVGGWNPNTDSTVRTIVVSKAPGATGVMSRTTLPTFGSFSALGMSRPVFRSTPLVAVLRTKPLALMSCPVVRSITYM